MKLQEIVATPYQGQEAIRRWIAMAVCVVAALIISVWIATDHLLLLAVLAVATLVVVAAVGLRHNTWLLIAFACCFTGDTNALPIPLTIYDMVVLVVTASYVAQRLIGTPAARRPLGLLDALVAINCAVMTLTFLVHPVGLRSLGAETVGARPYFNLFIACCACWVLARQPDSYTHVSRIPLWIMAGMTIATSLPLAAHIFPSLTPYVWFVSGNVDVTNYLEDIRVVTAMSGEHVRRLTELGPFGLMLIQCLCAYYLPRSLLNPLRPRFYLFAIGLAAVLLAGYRNTLLFAFATLVLASWFRGGWRELVLGGAIGALTLGFVLVGQGRFYELPMPAQRALSFLPGKWAEPVKEEAEDSNARLDWWRQMLQEGVIKNWWIGDGFGLSEMDYELLHGHSITEFAALSGAFHNGPLTAIRYAGVTGLVAFYALMLAAAVLSVTAVGRCRGTPLFPVAIFLAVQLVWLPVHYTFVFGAFNEELPNLIFLVGLLLLVRRLSARQPPRPPGSPAARHPLRNGRDFSSVASPQP
ncbi:MAG TPA: hypothetical protein VMV72_10090 [Verrucomicrobiae bacterium]|nr:hypothetical protein [Verrucomicrobiae bacterium]